MSVLCELTDMTRQNFYKRRQVRRQLSVDERMALDLIHYERSRQPKLGGRKLMRLLGEDLRAAGVWIGRDRFFALMRRHELLIERKKQFARTTDSRHGFRMYPNLAKGLELVQPHQLWVSDITYIRTLEGFMYLCLMMDAFSRAVVGWDCSDSLEMQGALRALGMGLKQRPVGAVVMHHSDRGVQYCCGPYIERLNGAKVSISMTEENHCYENSKAERLNGTMKGEYGLGETFAAKRQVRPAVAEAVDLYNHHRPHEALDYRMPMQVHGQAEGGIGGVCLAGCDRAFACAQARSQPARQAKDEKVK